MNNATTFAKNAVDLIKKEQERLNKAIQLVVGQICETDLLTKEEKQKTLLDITNSIIKARGENTILSKEIGKSISLLESKPLEIERIEKPLPIENKFKNIFKDLKEDIIELEKAPRKEEEE